MGISHHLNNLIQGRRYFFRASSGNLKGFGSFASCHPTSIVPSSWRDMSESEKERRLSDQRETFDRISNFVAMSKRENHQDDSAPRRNHKKKTTIKQLFTAASKFQKSLKRGIHLACICYAEDKVLVTNEDFIPVIEIDETYPNSLNNDFYWLMKISMSWDCVKDLRDDMEKNELTKVQFRCKILNAIHQMQMALGITDLGKFYYKPLKDSDGTVVFTCILNAKEPKSSMNLRWVPLLKLQKKFTMLLEDTSTINEILLNSISTQINFQQASRQKLSRGLYLGYLKIFSSFDTIQIVCQSKNPNVLPNCKIRDNPHVSAEEWAALQPKDSQKTNASMFFDLEKYGSNLSEAQQIFVDSLKLSLNRLFKFMNVSTENALQHRLYVEVIELDNDVTFLLICSPLAENAILTKGEKSFNEILFDSNISVNFLFKIYTRMP
jgi:ankyrin repeat and fibronectin type-III domain-containing protein 1